jgi:hypothetical protein
MGRLGRGRNVEPCLLRHVALCSFWCCTLLLYCPCMWQRCQRTPLTEPVRPTPPPPTATHPPTNTTTSIITTPSITHQLTVWPKHQVEPGSRPNLNCRCAIRLQAVEPHTCMSYQHSTMMSCVGCRMLSHRPAGNCICKARKPVHDPETVKLHLSSAYIMHSKAGYCSP